MNKEEEFKNVPRVNPEGKLADEQLEKVAAGLAAVKATDGNKVFIAAQGEVAATKQGAMDNMLANATKAK